MIAKLEAAVFKYITDLMAEYNIPIEFRYDENLDLLTEFKKSIRLRVENKEVFDELAGTYIPKEDDSGNLIHNLGLYSRQPLMKNPDIGNNMNYESYSKKLYQEYGIEMRYSIFGQLSYTVRMMFDVNEVANIMEMLYVYSLSNQIKSVKLDFDLGEDMEPIEEVNYSIQFDPIASIGTLNGTNLRYIDFSILITGLFFLPFYKDESLLESIVIGIHAMNRTTPPTPENATNETLVHKQTHILTGNK